ncbi:MAG: hypothetical protein P8Y94_04790 [Acidobacteriota bacterium]
MLKQQRIPINSPAEWKRAFIGVDHKFGHARENCHAMRLTTHFETCLYCFESNATRIICPIAEREYEGYVDIVKPSGFSGFVGTSVDAEYSGVWKECAAAQGYVCGYLAINPIFDWSAQFDPQDIYPHPDKDCGVYVWDVTVSSDKLFAGFSSNRRKIGTA